MERQTSCVRTGAQSQTPETDNGHIRLRNPDCTDAALSRVLSKAEDKLQQHDLGRRGDTALF
jgi:hypothetical protein